MSSYVDKQVKKNTRNTQRRDLELVEDFMTVMLLQLITMEPSFAPSTNIHNCSASMSEDCLVFQSSKILSARSIKNVKALIVANLRAWVLDSPNIDATFDIASTLPEVKSSPTGTCFVLGWLYNTEFFIKSRTQAFNGDHQDLYGSLRCVRAEQMVLLGMLPAVPATLKATLRPSLQTITKFFEDRKDKHVITFNKEQFAKHFRRAGESDLLFKARVDLFFKMQNLYCLFALTHIIITRDTNHNPVQLGGGL